MAAFCKDFRYVHSLDAIDVTSVHTYDLSAVDIDDLLDILAPARRDAARWYLQPVYDLLILLFEASRLPNCFVRYYDFFAEQRMYVSQVGVVFRLAIRVHERTVLHAVKFQVALP